MNLNSPLPVNSKSRKFTGAVYTPDDVANEITKQALKGLTWVSHKVLEPSVGDGAFLRSVASRTGLTVTTVAVDIDEHAITTIKRDLDPEGLENTLFYNESFLAFAERAAPRSFDLVIGNPPFIRKHNFSPEFRDEIAALAARTDYPLSSLKNSWAAFLVAAEPLVGDDGVMAFVLPYELLTVNYGQSLLAFLSSKFQHVEVLVPDEKAFKEIEQDAVAIIARRRSKDEGLFVHRTPSLANLIGTKLPAVPKENGAHNSLSLKSFLLDSATIELLQRLRSKAKLISDTCESSPGIVTAANGFFIIDREKARHLGLEPWVVPILKNGGQVAASLKFDSATMERLEGHETCLLLDLTNMPDDVIPPEVEKYLEEGIRLGVNDRFKCRQRKNWYKVPVIAPSPAFFLRRSHQFPKLMTNDLSILTTDTAYGIRPRAGYTAQGIVSSFYNSLTLLFSEVDGRFYGGGVLELTPKEFRALPLVYGDLPSPALEELEKSMTEPDAGLTAATIGDRYLKTHFALSDEDIEKIRRAWTVVREHRQRHGGR